jgi:hypothetical protein
MRKRKIVALTVGADVDVDVGDDVLDGVDDLLEDDTFAEFCLEHWVSNGG